MGALPAVHETPPLQLLDAWLIDRCWRLNLADQRKLEASRYLTYSDCCMAPEVWLISILRHREGVELRPLDAASNVILHDRQLFGRLYTLLNRFIRPAFSCDWLHDVVIDSSAPELQEALKWLEEEVGLRPVFQTLVTPQQQGRFFPVRRERAAFPLDSSNWLKLMCVRAERGGEILSLKDGRLVAAARKEEAKRQGHCLDLTFRAFAVTEDFKRAFEDAGLVGAVFRPLEYDPPDLRCKRQYWLDSSVTAPWSPWPRRIQRLDGVDEAVGVELRETNEPLVGRTGSVGFDDEGYYGPGMAYQKTDMASYEGVDFMRMAEWTVEHRGVWRSEHIVSQRFWNWAKKFGIRFVMVGVKLLA